MQTNLKKNIDLKTIDTIETIDAIEAIETIKTKTIGTSQNCLPLANGQKKGVPPYSNLC